LERGRRQSVAAIEYERIADRRNKPPLEDWDARFDLAGWEPSPEIRVQAPCSLLRPSAFAAVKSQFATIGSVAMLLIGMFDSPFVRRVAVSMKLLGFAFEHANWSVGKDQARIRRYSPLGRVPTLVLEDGEVLIESAAILDHLDSLVGPDRALVPITGAARREVLQLMALAIGAAEKGRELIYERIARPPQKRHEPWEERCRSQMHGAFGEIERRHLQRPGRWLVGEHLTQADITLTCAWTFLHEALALDEGPYPSLTALADRCEALPEFVATHMPWFAAKL
jgi:glutathione S-transferase